LTAPSIDTAAGIKGILSATVENFKAQGGLIVSDPTSNLCSRLINVIYPQTVLGAKVSKRDMVNSIKVGSLSELGCHKIKISYHYQTLLRTATDLDSLAGIHGVLSTTVENLLSVNGGLSVSSSSQGQKS
jgi:hypothetical protein